MSGRRPKVGDVVEIQDMAGGGNESWHVGVVLRVSRQPPMGALVPGPGRLWMTVKVDGIEMPFLRSVGGPDKRWRRIRE